MCVGTNKHIWGPQTIIVGKKLLLNRMVSAKERRPGFEHRSHCGATAVILCLGRKFSGPSELYQFLQLQRAEHCVSWCVLMRPM